MYLHEVKKLLLIIILLLSFSGWSQITQSSPYTQHFPSGIIEDIDRSITLGTEEITIVSKTSQGKDIQSLVVQNEEINEAGNKVYYCTSQDGLHHAIAVLNENDGAPYLDIIQQSPSAPEETQHYRFLLD